MKSLLGMLLVCGILANVMLPGFAADTLVANDFK